MLLYRAAPWTNVEVVCNFPWLLVFLLRAAITLQKADVQTAEVITAARQTVTSWGKTKKLIAIIIN